jgi:hypothetical protein
MIVPEQEILFLFIAAPPVLLLVYVVHQFFGLAVRLVEEGFRLVGGPAGGSGISQGSKR